MQCLTVGAPPKGPAVFSQTQLHEQVTTALAATPTVTGGRFRDVRHDRAPRFKRKILNSAQMYSCYFEPDPLKWERKYDLPPGPSFIPHRRAIGQLQ